MLRSSAMHRTAGSEATVRPPVIRVLGHGRDWCVNEYVCSAGPGDRAFEERHAHFTVAAVIEGSFEYKAQTGTALLHPGAFLLGNYGTCFECGHDHSAGDRCVAFHFTPEYFAEVAATAAGSGQFRFPVSMVPALSAGVPWLARIEAQLARSEQLAADEAVAQLMQFVVGAISGCTSGSVRTSARDARRVSDALGFIEQRSADAIDLGQLAAVAAMSKFHFLRTFRRTVGLTPYQYLLHTRMRHAAVRLLTTSESIASIAFDAGFGDLSTFNRSFRVQFGASPTAYRARSKK